MSAAYASTTVAFAVTGFALIAAIVYTTGLIILMMVGSRIS